MISRHSDVKGRFLRRAPRWLSAYVVRHKSAIKLTLPMGWNRPLHAISDTNSIFNNLILVVKRYDTVGNITFHIADTNSPFTNLVLVVKPYDTVGNIKNNASG